MMRWVVASLWVTALGAACTRDNPAFFAATAGTTGHTSQEDDGKISDSRVSESDSTTGKLDTGVRETDTGETGPDPSTTAGPGTTSRGTEGDTTHSSTTEPVLGNCCKPHDGPGCDQPDVADAVCQGPLTRCCEDRWDSDCASTAAYAGHCDGVAIEFSCCAPSLFASCHDARLVECACGNTVEQVCCGDNGWLPTCVDAAQSEVCALECGDCCTPHSEPSCSDGTGAAGVCDRHPYCCTVGWDEGCVATYAAEHPEICD